MISPDQVRGIAEALDGTIDQSTGDRLAFARGDRPVYAWTVFEPGGAGEPPVARLDILAVRCPMGRKEVLLDLAPDLYFDDEQYRGQPVILVRLDTIPRDELSALLKDAWRL